MKRSFFSQNHKIVRTDYTYSRPDGKTESRHVDRNGNSQGRTVSDKKGNSIFYDRNGNRK